MTTREERIAALEARLNELKGKQQRVEARRRHIASRRSHRDELRRETLVGAVILDRVAHGTLPEADLRQRFKSACTREDDRSILNL